MGFLCPWCGMDPCELSSFCYNRDIELSHEVRTLQKKLTNLFISYLESEAEIVLLHEACQDNQESNLNLPIQWECRWNSHNSEATSVTHQTKCRNRSMALELLVTTELAELREKFREKLSPCFKIHLRAVVEYHATVSGLANWLDHMYSHERREQEAAGTLSNQAAGESFSNYNLEILDAYPRHTPRRSDHHRRFLRRHGLRN